MEEGPGAPPEAAGATGIKRREFMVRGAAAGGSVAALWTLPGILREAYGQPIPVPEGARNVEAGLNAFAARYTGAGPVIRLTRFKQFVSDKIFNCRVADQPRAYVLRLPSVGASSVTPGTDPFRHGDMAMPEADWLGLLYGDYTGLAPLLGGDSFPARDQSNKVALVGILMYVMAHIPAGADPDPDLLGRVLQSLVREGLPECPGELDPFPPPRVDELSEMVVGHADAPPVTRRLAEFTAGLRYEDLPAGTIAAAKEQLKSILGAMYGGSRMPPGRKFASAVRAFGDRPEATVIGRDCFRTSARHAAMVNSVNAQVLEWEDWTFIIHSGASIIPTALAAAELERRSGRDLIAAIVAGNEILARSGEVLTDVIHAGNAVPTHQIETPLVAGKLLGLGTEQLQDAVGIACVQPQVTAIPGWTADAKGLLSGWPVLTGLEAAQYAQAGISGRRDILENPLGYCYRVSDIPSPQALEHLVEGLGETWRFDSERNELFSKRFPTDGFQLTSVQAILDIVNGQAKDVWDATPRSAVPDLVRRVEVRMPWVMAATATMFPKDSRDIYDRIRNEPDWTYIALLFDGKYPLAAALAHRRLTWREYRDRVIFEPAVQALIERIDLIPDLSQGVFGATARIELSDGRTFESRQECIADFDVAEKLRIGAGGLLTRGQIERISRAVDRIESYSDIREFVSVLCPRHAGARRRRRRRAEPRFTG